MNERICTSTDEIIYCALKSSKAGWEIELASGRVSNLISVGRLAGTSFAGQGMFSIIRGPGSYWPNWPPSTTVIARNFEEELTPGARRGYQLTLNERVRR